MHQGPEDSEVESSWQWTRRIRERTTASLAWVVAGAVTKDGAKRSADELAELREELAEVERALRDAAGE